MAYTAQQICEHVGGELSGPGQLVVEGIEAPQRAASNQACYIGEQSLVPEWESSRAGVALVDKGITIEDDPNRAIIRTADGDMAFIRLLEMFAPPPPAIEPGVHPTAVIDPSASIGEGVRIGAGCYVGPHVTIGERTVLHARVTIYQDSEIGADSECYPGVVIRERCRLGHHVRLHPNVVIGADGFGFRPARDGKGFDGTGVLKVPQIGQVVIGNHVELGAGTCVDRGTFSDTVVGDGTKIDNLCQIGHNCRIGRSVIMAGQVGLAGSVSIGDGSMIGGQVGVKDHIRIGAKVKLAACSAVMNDIPDGATWGGYPARDWKEAVQGVLLLRKMEMEQGKGRKERKARGATSS